MNKFFLLLFFFSASIYAKTTKHIIVAFSLNDCISGSASLYELNKILKNPEMTIVFEQELIVDSTLVKKKTGIDNFRSAVTVYSDDLFKKYSNGI